MESLKNKTTPCSSGGAACNPASSVIPHVADPDTFNNSNWPRFLVIKSLDEKPIVNHNMFVIAKAIEGIAGKPVSVKRLMNAGLLLIEVDRRHYATNLLKATQLHDIPVEISPHRTMNSCKGVINCNFRNDMDTMTDQEFKEELINSGQGITDVYRIMLTKNGKKEPSNTYILTFDSDKLPEKIVIGFMRVNVRIYVPNPRRCYNCQQFGHTTKFCKQADACENCGQTGHKRDGCNNPTKCINCGEAHPASSRSCSQWKLKKEILQLKFEMDIPYPEAERRVLANRQIVNQTSYATAVAPPTKPKVSEISIQTEMTWPNDIDSPMLISEYNNLVKEQSVKEVSVQCETNMDFENGKSKRGRSVSSSSQEDDMPNIDKPQTKKKANANRVGSTLSKERDQPSSGGTATNEGVGRRDGGNVYPDHLSRCKGRGSHHPSSLSSVPRSGSPVTPGSATRRDRSPINPP